MSINRILSKTRPLLAIIFALSLLFYYTFLNEEHELNQHQIITTQKPVPGSEESVLNYVNSQKYKHPELATLPGLKEKNKYFPLLEKESKHSRIDNFELPPAYFSKQFGFKLRKNKKKIRYDVGHENYHKLPKLSKPAEYPTIQTTQFTDGGAKDEEKLAVIRSAFQKSWKTYVDYGYGHDEVQPLSHAASDPFNGWSATLVDTLDTLKLLGLNDEFDKAVKFLNSVNFKQSFRDDIPIFENTIRILGGLLSGYEVSQEKSLLKHAKEFGNLLIEAFDTPNNMPLLYYKWRDELSNRLPSKEACLAEVGSLSLEFTRLSQLTGDNKFYDAITRITNLLDKSFDEFFLPGLYSTRVDISGCKSLNKEQAEGISNSKALKIIHNDDYEHCIQQDKITPSLNHEAQTYSLGGLGDSFYEYMPKMFHFLRGHEKDAKVYKDMYIRAMQQVREYMLYTPKIPGGEKSLYSSTIDAARNLDDDTIIVTQQLDTSHLTCFAGGMFALGSRLFNISEDLEIAEKITYGCVDLYEKLKIMPEFLVVDKMESINDKYDEEERLFLIKMADKKDLGNLVTDNVELLEKEYSKSQANQESNSHNPKEDLESNDEKTVDQIVKRDESTVKQTLFSKPRLVSSNAQKLQPFTTLPNGSKVWTVGKTYNQPLYINSMEPKYIMRPEAIESVWYMYRITGDAKWRQYGWNMWLNVQEYCKTPNGSFASLKDVTKLGDEENFVDSLESFWFAETLKYYYLLFEDHNIWSLDDFVLNTEAHPFKLSH